MSTPPAPIVRRRTGTRRYFCRTCRVEVRSATVPAGWYSLTRHVDNAPERLHRLGIFCSASCLEQQIPRLRGIEQDLGDDWAEAVEQGARKRD